MSYYLPLHYNSLGASFVERILEPELMDDYDQALAYHEADFSQAHGERVELFRARAPAAYHRGSVLDLGCGSGDVVMRFARAFPQMRILGVDGSEPMIRIAREAVQREPEIRDRLKVEQHFLPSTEIPKDDYAVVMSHSFLHHLHDPSVLWRSIQQMKGSKSFVFVADLRRPPSLETAKQTIDTLAANEPEVLREDFYNSLCAAFTADEIKQQLVDAGLSQQLRVEEIGDIHILVYGMLS